ncbi:MAG: hydroxymethylpyrimidine/phosphomethylpyrimidine kinase [Candidatus Zixiibacteriota bacterium]|nr:MAG: hydroxymethylpyrimidine/phosphomethylpyrimidine kinase [candidate division Zixibacteria bacterium]
MKPQTNSTPQRPAVLTIAGFDPTGGAGVLADAAVIRALGFHPLAVLTSVAAQGSSRITQIMALPRTLMSNEFDVISAEFRPAAVKIGMIYSPAAVRLTTYYLEEQPVPAVLDPILRASSGGELIQLYTVPLLQARLVPLCRVITPNITEAAYFLGREIRDASEAERAARELNRRWGTAVLLKGGHLSGEPEDILVDGGKVERFPHPRVAPNLRLRGAGCVTSAALTCGLAKGLELRDAVAYAQDYVRAALEGHYTSGNDPEIGFLPLPTRP